MARLQITLQFLLPEGTEDAEAWRVAEGLEEAAIRQGYHGVSAWPTATGGGRVLAPLGEEPPAQQAEAVEAITTDGAVTAVAVDPGSSSVYTDGPVSLGDEHGRRG